MLNTILGTKAGMTQIFDGTGNIIPVTVISAGPCVITDICTKERNGYTAVQLGFGQPREKSMTRPFAGQFKKKNIPAKKYLREVRLDNVSEYQVGQEIKADIFKAGEYVDVSGISKGKGFAGAVKRHNFAGGVTTHGQSDRQRAVGSMGSQRPTHTIKGKRMPGHLGHELVTIQKIKIISVDPENNIIMLNGAVPGTNNSLIVIKRTIKRVKTEEEKQKGQAGAKKKVAAKK